MRHSNAINRVRRTAAGFSLVELLTVVAIIVLLIGILVPAVNAVRTKGKETVTKGLIGSLSTGMDTFRADQMVGGAYGPSASDYVRNGRLQYSVRMPRPPGASGPMALDAPISGAGLLLWALAGADLQGTPGFRTFRSGTQYWALDSDNENNNDDPTQSGAYALRTNTRQPLQKRAAPFIDISKVDITPWNAKRSVYEVAAEVKAYEALGLPAPRRGYPMFLDAFGGPILYWRSDPAGVQIADETPNTLLQPTDRGFYHFYDNAQLLTGTGPTIGAGEDPLLLRADLNRNNPHNLVWDDTVNLTDPMLQQKGFAGYIRNKTAVSRVTPNKKDSYLMISAGADGVYGTADDIANFEHNGAELTQP